MDQFQRLVQAGYLSIEALEVANRILALLLAALARETVINGAGELFQAAVRQLREMGSSGNACFSMYAVQTPVCAFPGLT